MYLVNDDQMSEIIGMLAACKCAIFSLLNDMPNNDLDNFIFVISDFSKKLTQIPYDCSIEIKDIQLNEKSA